MGKKDSFFLPKDPLIIMAWYHFGLKSANAIKDPAEARIQQAAGGMVAPSKEDEGIFKAYIPEFLYKPPYGYPRKTNLVELKALAKNAYVFSIIKTLCDEASSVPWKIKVKEDFNDKKVDYSDKLKEITRFFKNPNGNDESFESHIRMIVTGILTVDAGVWIKVYNELGEMKHLFVRDGATFLKNPDIYGYLGMRADFVAPFNYESIGNMATPMQLGYEAMPTKNDWVKQYDLLYKSQAAYFQYGWTAGSMPVPFGKREVVYIMQNPQPDSIYGKSPIEVLKEIILSLKYGSEYNLDFYTNNNIPDGVLELLGAQREHIEQFRDNWESKFTYVDEFNKKRKQFYKIPISSVPTKYTPFQITSKDMEVLAQQEWFTKIMWMTFGVNANEMGFTETVNKSVGEEQSKIARRKALRPLLNVIQYHINTQIITEFFDPDAEDYDFGDVPVEFVFDLYDADEDLKKLDILEREIRMGIKTPEMAAKERGIDLEELEKSKVKVQKEQMAQLEQQMSLQQQNPNQNPQEQKQPFFEQKARQVKYIKRWKGKNGEWEYEYPGDEPKGKAPKAEEFDDKVREKLDDIVKHFDEFTTGDLKDVIGAIADMHKVPEKKLFEYVYNKGKPKGKPEVPEAPAAAAEEQVSDRLGQVAGSEYEGFKYDVDGSFMRGSIFKYEKEARESIHEVMLSTPKKAKEVVKSENFSFHFTTRDEAGIYSDAKVPEDTSGWLEVGKDGAREAFIMPPSRESMKKLAKESGLKEDQLTDEFVKNEFQRVVHYMTGSALSFDKEIMGQYEKAVGGDRQQFANDYSFYALHKEIVDSHLEKGDLKNDKSYRFMRDVVWKD